MTTLQQTLDTWSNVLNKPIPVADDESSIDSKGVDFATKYLINLNNDQFAAPGSASTDQDLIASAAESNKFETIMPDTSWAGLNLREVARGSQQQSSQAVSVIATPSLRADFIRSLMKPAEAIANLLSPLPKTPYEEAIIELTKRNLSQQLSMAVEPAGSGLTASPQDLQSEIIALRGTQQGLSQGQQEGFMGDVSRGFGQSLPSFAVTAGTIATGGALLPAMLASQVYTPMASYTNSKLAYIDELEQRRYDQALAGEPLSEFDPVEMGRRAELGAIIETSAEAGGAAFGAKYIGKVAKGVGTSSAARYATNKFAKSGAVKAATEVVRRSGSAAGRAFAAANEGVMNFTPGFIYRSGQIFLIGGLEEAGEEGYAAALNAPMTYAPWSKDVSDGLYSMAVGGVAGGAGGAASSVGLAVREAVVNRNDAFRPETDRERIVRQTHSDAMKARSNWSEGLEQTQRDRIAAKLDTIEGMTPDERGTYVMALADRKAEIIANAEATLAERQEVDVAMTGAQEVLDKAKAAAGTASPTADQDIYEAEFALLVLQDKAKQLDEQLVLANTDHMIATAEHGAVAEKISDMPATVVRSTPAEVLTSVGTRSGVALNETKAPRWGKKIANEMEALGTQVVWYTPADKKSSNPGFHSRRTPGVIYLNAASNQQRVRAVALEEAFHDIQMFRPDIAKAFVDKAGLFPVYEAALEYVSRGGAETAAIERQDEAAFAQMENVADTLEGKTSDISPNTARAGAARISQEGEANAFARAMAGIKAKGAMSSLTRLAARSGLMGRESLAAMAVVDRVARSAAIEAVSGKTGDATLSPLARTLMWASDMDVDFARDIPTADRELSEPISPPAAPVAAKPKMDRVAHKREKESGRYVGAPDWVGNSPAQLAKLRFKLRKLAKEGEAGRYWYEDSSRAILEMTGGDKVEAEKIVSLIAIYSPNATVSANTTMALTAYYQFKAGLDINAGFSKADEKATALLKNGQAWSGIKTNSFYQNLMVEIDPSKLDTNVSTMDMWMAIAFDYGDKVLDQGSKYRFAERETARLAQELGWTAHQVQAAIWSAMKGRIDPIRGQLKAEELRLGIGEMVTKVDPDTGKESLVYEVKKDKKKEHFRLAHKMGMEYDLQDKDINAAKFDFSTALRDRMVQQSYETTPSTTSGAPIPGIHTATLDKVFEYQRALAPVLFPNGKDIVAEMVGLPQGDTIEGVSAWESKVQTGIQSFVAAPTDKSGKAKRLKPSAIKLLDLAARIRGYALTQDAVAYHTAVFDDAKIRHNGIELRTNRALSHQEIELFYRALHEKFNRWDLNPIYRKDGLRVLNFTQFDKSQKPVSNKEFKDAWQTIVQSLPDTFGGGIVGSASFRSEGNNVSNDWSKDKNGEGYLDRITAERPDILGQVRNLRLAVQAVNDQFVAKYGWDKAGVSFARSDERRTVGNGVEQPTAGTLTPLAGSPVIQGFTGPDPSIVDVAKRYAASRGIDFKRQAEYADVDPERAARIADAYQTMVHDPQNPAVADAYEQLIEQTTAQYQMLVDAGYQFYFFDPENDPYADQPGGFGNPYNAVRDLRANKRMAVFPSESGFGSGATDIDVSNNPLLADTGLQWAFGTPDGTLKRVTANDLFRAVHDAMGHSIEGAGFRARGEENAWQAHVRLFTGSAIGAMTSETRGQNSWLNFGPFGEKNKAAKVEDTTFADQKVGLMPSFTWEDGRVPDESFAREDKRDADYMAAVDRGDITAAQRMVDEKAKAAGYNVDVFRGDASAFRTFLKSEQGKNFEDVDVQVPSGFFWFTTSQTSAERYAKFASRKGGIPTVRRFYLNPGNIFVYPTEAFADEGFYGVPSVESELAQVGDYNSMLIPNTAKWVTERDEAGELQYKLDEGKYKYYAVTNPTQIKSADPITYDESGNVVPLSRRFDDTNQDISFSREDERDAAFQKMQADRRAAQELRMKDLSPREQGNIIEAGVADYYEILDLKDKIDKLKKQIAGGTPAAVEKSKRTADLQTAAQRVNALSEVRKLERKLNAMTMLADQRLGQVNRAKARLQTQTQLAIEEQQSAAETIASLEEQITATRDAVVAAKRSIAEERTATKEQRDALNTALANAEATAQRAINWAYAIGRNEGLVAGQVAGQQAVQTDLERGQQAEEKLKELQKSERFQKFASQRAIDWAYRIGRNEGLVAGQVAGQQTLKPEMTRLARVESLLDISVRRVRELKATVRNDARAAQRAVNFAYSMGLNKGRMQGIMQGRAQILAKMRKREDTLQNQLFNLRELMNTRLDDVAERNRIIRKIVSEALLSIPANLRGTLANRAATATTVAQANRVAIEAVRIAINAEATEGLKVIARTAKRMNKRGMKWSARQQIVTLLYDANRTLRDANNRKRQAKVVTAKGSPVTLSGAIDLYSRVLDAQNKVDNAVALYDTDRASFIVEQDQRIARYADLTKRILANMAGRRVMAARARADQAARLSLISKISRANSDIYTLTLELEGVEDGVIDELLRIAQAGKGEAALEHARIMRDLEPALIAAGYEGVDDYRLKNGGYGDGSTELVTVSLGGQDVTIPLGIAMSIAAMDAETLALFDGTNAGKQGIQFNETSTTLTLYPSRADIETIYANLTVGQRNLIERMKDILETQIRDRAMQAIWEVTGEQPPIVARYYPRIRNMLGIGGENLSVSAAISAAVRGALTSVGFANARTGGNAPLIYTDMVQTMDRHMQVALDMIHMAQPYRDAMTVLNNADVVKGIDDQLGAGTANGVRSIFSNGVGATARTKPTIFDLAAGNVTGAVLGMNPNTIAKVLIGGTVRLSSEIPLSLWSRGVARTTRYARKPSTFRARVEQIHSVNGYFSRRHQMQMKSIFSGALRDEDRARLGSALKAMRDNLRAAGANLAAAKITDAIDAAGDFNRAGTMGLSALVDMLRYADEQIMLAAVEARLAEVEDEGLLTGNDALTEASNRAERDFRKTQNASDEFDDSFFAATSRTDGNAGWRLLLPFSSDPIKARNQIRRAVLTGNRTRTAFAVGGNIASSTTISSLSTIVSAKVIAMVVSILTGDDDDEEQKEINKSWWEKAAVSIPTSIASEVMSSTMGYVGIMFANALSSIVYRRAAFLPLVASPVEQIGMEVTGAFKKDAKSSDIALAVVGSTLATLQYGGIPFYSLYRYAMRALELVPDAPKTPREKLLDSIERKRKSLEKLRSN